MRDLESKRSPANSRDSFFRQLRNGNDVACLRSLGSLLDVELDLLTLLQVAVSIALDG